MAIASEIVESVGRNLSPSQNKCDSDLMGNRLSCIIIRIIIRKEAFDI